MHTCGRKTLANYRGGLLGVLVYLAISALVFLAGFMAAFGNDTPAARLVLNIFEIYFTVAFPLWAIPLSYFAGGFFICPGSQKTDIMQ
jgi:predicted lysophospholipase L1 biosynthesis ABC-type transport system permease subunit